MFPWWSAPRDEEWCAYVGMGVGVGVGVWVGVWG
jgi:hypothetical protein